MCPWGGNEQFVNVRIPGHPAEMEMNMAKGQKRSGREPKKPKKAVAEKQKAGAVSALRIKQHGTGPNPVREK